MLRSLTVAWIHYSYSCEQLYQRVLRAYAVPKRMYKKDGSVGQSEKYSGLNEKKLSLMKGDKVVDGGKKLPNSLLLAVLRRKHINIVYCCFG